MLKPVPAKIVTAPFRDGACHGLEGMMTAGALHEIFSASPSDAAAAACFALGALKPQKLLWIRQELTRVEAGEIYPPGLLALGFKPDCITLVPLRDAQSLLQAGLEAARCTGLDAAIIELWGQAKPYTLTASRKLMLAAKASGTKLCIINHAAMPSPSAAETRWQVRRLASTPWKAGAPGFPAFEVTLLRQRSNASGFLPHWGQVWSVEWDYEQQRFKDRTQTIITARPSTYEPPLFKLVVSLPAFRKVPLHKAA